MAVDAYTYEVELKDGAAEYLRYLKEKGIPHGGCYLIEPGAV